MKITMTETVEKEVTAIRCEVAVRYEDEDMPNDYPHRKNDMWDVTIDVETGQIKDWPAGVEPRNLYMKITDAGSYYLLGPDGAVVSARTQNYVPSRCIPGEYGDYIHFNIDGSGKITNWYFRPENFSGDDD